MTSILDTSALLAAIQAGACADRVRERLCDAAMSPVDHRDGACEPVERGLPEDETDATLASFDIVLHPQDAAQARAAGLLRRTTRAAGRPLGARACFALARSLGAPALTAARARACLDIGVTVEVIR